MDLSRYFQQDDGSLPELALHFDEPQQLTRAFGLLFELGAIDGSAHGGIVHLDPSADGARFAGPDDVTRVVASPGGYLHFVASRVVSQGVVLPDLGVYLVLGRMDIDYRMGPEWSTEQIAALVELLRRLLAYGGRLSAPSWGQEGERDFLAALGA